MTPMHLVVLKLVVMGLLGVPLALLFDPSRTFFYVIGQRSTAYIMPAYWWSLYAVTTLGVCLALARQPRAVARYQQRPTDPLPTGRAQGLWAAALGATVLCLLVLFVQNGLRHPALTALLLGDPTAVAILRIETSRTINMSVYNVGVHLGLAFALTLAVFFLRSARHVAVTLAVGLALITFSLAKSPVADLTIELAFIYLLLRRPSWGVVPVLGAALVLGIGAMAWLTGWSSNLDAFWLQVGLRIVWGQVADLPHYLNLFQGDHAPWASMLPPYVQSALGFTTPSAAHLVAAFSNPEALRLGTAGVFNTLFVGEAYAVGGASLALLAPAIVAANYAMVTALFQRLPKNAFTVFAFGFLLDRMTVALFGGLSSFVFSSIHVLLAAVLFAVLVRAATPAPSADLFLRPQATL